MFLDCKSEFSHCVVCSDQQNGFGCSECEEGFYLDPTDLRCYRKNL